MFKTIYQQEKTSSLQILFFFFKDIGCRGSFCPAMKCRLSASHIVAVLPYLVLIIRGAGSTGFAVFP